MSINLLFDFSRGTLPRKAVHVVSTQGCGCVGPFMSVAATCSAQGRQDEPNLFLHAQTLEAPVDRPRASQARPKRRDDPERCSPASCLQSSRPQNRTTPVWLTRSRSVETDSHAQLEAPCRELRSLQVRKRPHPVHERHRSQSPLQVTKQRPRLHREVQPVCRAWSRRHPPRFQ
jgi:hypothetical protein